MQTLWMTVRWAGLKCVYFTANRRDLHYHAGQVDWWTPWSCSRLLVQRQGNSLLPLRLEDLVTQQCIANSASDIVAFVPILKESMIFFSWKSHIFQHLKWFQNTKFNESEKQHIGLFQNQLCFAAIGDTLFGCTIYCADTRRKLAGSQLIPFAL